MPSPCVRGINLYHNNGCRVREFAEAVGDEGGGGGDRTVG